MRIRSFFHAIATSFSASLGDIVFGMEDGAVSIVGLVFGVAASTRSSALVLLAGATGAVSAAVAMMAGNYLQIASVRGQAQAELAQKQAEMQHHPQEEEARIAARLRSLGCNEQDVTAILQALRRTPTAMLEVEAVWMFVSVLFAASVPVAPFACFPLTVARIIALVITALLLLLLGAWRGRVAHRHLVLAAFETLGIATTAALAGILIGKLVTL